MTNLAEILNSADPTLSFQWKTSGITVSKFGTTTDTLKLTRAYTSGVLQVELCADNDWMIVCDTIAITTELAPARANANLALSQLAIGSSGSQLVWNSAARILIWDAKGTVIADFSGKKGTVQKLNRTMLAAYQNGTFKIHIR